MGISDEILKQAYDAFFGGQSRPESRAPITEEEVQEAETHLFDDAPFAPYGRRNRDRYFVQGRKEALREARGEADMVDGVQVVRRVTNLESVDLVTEPASTKSLFESLGGQRKRGTPKRPRPPSPEEQERFVRELFV